jgi:hypothetical protein
VYGIEDGLRAAAREGQLHGRADSLDLQSSDGRVNEYSHLKRREA